MAAREIPGYGTQGVPVELDMLAQFPIADVRKFTHSAGMIAVSAFQELSPWESFVRSFGQVRERTAWETEWNDESIYCRALHALRLPDGFGSPTQHPQLKGFQCFLRRLLSDGQAVSRMEVGVSSPELYIEGEAAIYSMIESLLALPVKVNRVQHTFCDSGKFLAEHYLRSTTGKNIGVSSPEQWWVKAGQPILLIEYYLNSNASLSLPKRAVPVSTFENAGISLSHLYHFTRNGKRVGVWFIGHGPDGSDSERSRALRLHLLRLHAERECLRIVLSHIAEERIIIDPGSAESDSLQRFLTDKIKLLRRKKAYGIEQSELLATAYRIDGFIYGKQRDRLLNQVERIRPAIRKLIQREIDRGRPIMNNVEVNINGNPVFMGDFVAAGVIQDSFNQVADSQVSAQLKAELTNLHEEFAKLARELPIEEARQASEDLKVFTSEAVKPNPRRKWYELSSEGIIEAAKTCAEIGTPVITIVKSILSLIAPLAA